MNKSVKKNCTGHQRRNTVSLLYCSVLYLPVDVLLRGHTPPLVDPLLQLGHGALSLCYSLRSRPGHKAPPQYHVLLLLPGVLLRWTTTTAALWVSLSGTVSTVTPGGRLFAIAVVGHDIVGAVVGPTIRMMI